VALLGSVRLAAIYELRGQESIDVCSKRPAAEPLWPPAGASRWSASRTTRNARLRAECRCDRPCDLAGDGDIVRIDPIISNYRETVTLRGSVANPGRFLWHAGMRLSELLRIAIRW